MSLAFKASGFRVAQRMAQLVGGAFGRGSCEDPGGGNKDPLQHPEPSTLTTPILQKPFVFVVPEWKPSTNPLNPSMNIPQASFRYYTTKTQEPLYIP